MDGIVASVASFLVLIEVLLLFTKFFALLL